MTIDGYEIIQHPTQPTWLLLTHRGWGNESCEARPCENGGWLGKLRSNTSWISLRDDTGTGAAINEYIKTESVKTMY